MHKHYRHRRGLSTLELVLALPILLFVMALMINFGTVACWKVRGLSVARNVLWSTRWPRSGGSNPRPDYWPAAAGVNVGGTGNVTELDDPRVDQPVARGPLPLAGAEVNVDLLDPTRGLRQGSATLDRGFAMLAKMGMYHLKAETALLDDRWQYGQMGVSRNNSRRIPILYTIQTAAATYVGDYVQAVVAIYYASFREALKPLDNDEEFIYYNQLFGWGGGAPDFHPRLSSFCSLDESLANDRVKDLIDRIQGKVEKDEEGNVTLRIRDVAENMTRAFISLYERAIQAYQDAMNADPSPSDVQIAAMQAEINQLQQKIDVLNQYLQTLQSNDGG